MTDRVEEMGVDDLESSTPILFTPHEPWAQNYHREARVDSGDSQRMLYRLSLAWGRQRSEGETTVGLLLLRAEEAELWSGGGGSGLRGFAARLARHGAPFPGPGRSG